MVFKRQTQGSVVCPSCGRLVGVQDAECFGCGRKNPGLWGFAPALKSVTGDFSFTTVIFYGCIGIYLVSCLINLDQVLAPKGLLSLFSPGKQELFLMGASGSASLYGEGRWWTPWSAMWLHGGLLHIGFNLYYLRGLSPVVEQLFGLGRTAIIYVLSGVIGFAGTSTIGLLALPVWFSGARGLTVGASASLCGMLGALYAYGRAHKDWRMQQSIQRTGIFLLVIGLVIPIIDNWAHIFGFLGGWLVATVLKPREDDAASHLVVGGVLVVISILAVAVSVWTGLDTYKALLARG